MTRQLNKLSARAVERLAKCGPHADGGGLYLRISPGSRRWIFRFTREAKTREMGLGAYPAVPLAEARERAREARAHLTAGRDPIVARDDARKAEQGRKTFGEVADALLEAKSSEWRSEKHRAQWAMTLSEYGAPLRPMPG